MSYEGIRKTDELDRALEQPQRACEERKPKEKCELDRVW